MRRLLTRNPVRTVIRDEVQSRMRDAVVQGFAVVFALLCEHALRFGTRWRQGRFTLEAQANMP